MSDLEPVLEANGLAGIASPRNAPGLLGHEDVFELLGRQLRDNRLPSGILLHGPLGIGKATLAFQLAIEVLTQTGDEPIERVRQQVHAGSHPNLYELRRVKREKGVGFYNEIRVDGLRAIISKLHQTRGREAHRLLIVDAIDDCNLNGANALLKTLEEPPPDTHIILISHRPGRLLPTIRSRCQAHGMRPISDEQVTSILQSGGETDMDCAQAVAFANGRPRRGFEALALKQNQVLEDLSNWLKAPHQASADQTLKLGETLGDKKNEIEARFAREILLNWIAMHGRTYAISHTVSSGHVVSTMELWEKANLLFDQTDTYNLDTKQSFIILFDQIATLTSQVAENS